VIDNSAPLHHGGGGIYNDGLLAGVLTVMNSRVSNNTMGAHGGGILNRGSATVINSTISGNVTGVNGFGAGIFNLGASDFTARLTAINATISGNRSGAAGGGIYNHGAATVHLNNVTVTDNTAGVNAVKGGGGINNGSDGAFVLQNTLIAGNQDLGLSPARDCSAGGSSDPVTSQGYNLIQDLTSCSVNGDTTGNITGVDPRLGPLADNGGSTKTHALLTDSPAIDAGRLAPVPGGGGPACAATDQQGFVRPLGAACDIGAYERFQEGSSVHIVPKTGGNTGSVTALIYGFNVTGGASVKLTRGGEPNIVASPVGMGGGAILSATFDLAGRATGPWNVVVTGQDGVSETLDGGFTIEEGRAPELWTDILGPPAPRFGRPARYTIFFGNHGNMDAVGVPLTISVPAGYAFNAFVSWTPPPPQPAQVREDWRQVPVTVETEALGGFTNVPLLLPVLPPGFTGSFQIEITPPPDSPRSLILSAFGDPIYTPALDEGAVSKALAGAQTYLQSAGVTVPPELVPVLREYLVTQRRQAIERGRAAFVASLGTNLQTYSLSHLHFDLVFFAAAQVAAAPIASAPRIDPPGWIAVTSSVVASLLSELPAAAIEAQGQTGATTPCTGGVLREGETCTPPEKIYPPDIPPPPGCDLKKPSTFKNCKPTEDHCTALGTHRVIKTSDGAFCTPEKPPKNCPKGNIDNPLLGSGNAACKTWPLAPRRSIDPNDKVGSIGVTPTHFLLSATPLSYTVFFENLETATAAAQEVVITDQLDSSILDLETFSLGPIAFGDITVVPVSGVQQYSGGVDLRPRRDLLVLINAGLEKATGQVTWRLTAVDPDTLQFPDDPLEGFLPPNVNPPEGDGSVTFTVLPRPGLATGTTICNEASIVFDVNPPIVTPQWCNTLDYTPPDSHVLPLSPTQSSASFAVAWAGTDLGAGVLDYTIFVSENAGPFAPWLSETTASSAIFAGKADTTYAFYSVARDYAGSLEDSPAAADTTTQILGAVAVPGDLDGNGKVNLADRDRLRASLGTCRGDAKFNAGADFDDDGCVTYNDYRIWYGYYQTFLPGRR
jgi:hypothetical protein